MLPLPRFFRLFAWLLLGASSVWAQNRAYTEAVQLFQQHKYNAAIPKFEQSITENAATVDGYRALAFCYLQVKNGIKAQNTIDRGLRKFPNDFRLKSLRAELLLQSGQYDEALPILNELEQAMQRGVKIEGLTLGMVRARLGNLALMNGGKAYQANKKDKALQYFQQALQYMPDSLSAHHNVTLAYLEAEKWEQALASADAALHKFPANLTLIQMKGRALLELKRYKELEEAWKVLYDQKPNDLDIGLMYGQVLYMNQKGQDAQVVFDKLLTKFPKEKRLYEALVQINEQGFNYNAVTELLKRQRKQFPGDAGVVKKLAQSYEVMEEWPKARAMYDTLAVMTGESVKNALAQAKTFEKQDSLDVALAQYRQILERNPNDRETLISTGTLLRKMKRWTDARDTYQMLIRTDSTWVPWMRWAEAQEQLKAYPEAILGYEKAIQKGGQHPLPYYGLAKIRPPSDPRVCEWAETALRKSLRGVKALQEQQVAQVQSRSVQDVDERIQTKDALEEYDQLGSASFNFYTQTCPRPNVEGLLAELLRLYQGSGKFYYYVGTYYRWLGDLPRAKTYFTEAAQFAPQLTENQEALAQAYLTDGDVDQAILAWERVLSVKPDEPRAYSALIDLYRRQNQLNQLADKWMARYRATPRNTVLREHLIEALHKAGRLEEARQIAEKAREQDNKRQ